MHGRFTQDSLELAANDWIAQTNRKVYGTYSLVKIEIGE